jgi:hypothetical protein
MLDLMSILGSQKGELYYDLETGIAYCSMRLVGRLVGKSHTAISDLFVDGVCADNAGGRFLTSKGFKGGVLTPRGLPADLIESIIVYYSLVAGHRCTDKARDLAALLIQVGLTATIKRVLGVADDDREAITPQPTTPVLDVDVSVAIGSASHHAYLTPMQSHLDEVTRLRERIKKLYNTAEEQEEKAALLNWIKVQTLNFCGIATELKSAAIDAGMPDAPAGDDPNAKYWAAMDKAIAAPDITANVRKRLKKYKAIVTYRWNNPATPMPVLAEKFGVSVSNICTACSKFGYFDLESKPDVRPSARTTPNLEV